MLAAMNTEDLAVRVYSPLILHGAAVDDDPCECPDCCSTRLRIAQIASEGWWGGWESHSQAS